MANNVICWGWGGLAMPLVGGGVGLTVLLVWGGVRWCRVTTSLVGRWDGANNVTCLGWGEVV